MQINKITRCLSICIIIIGLIVNIANAKQEKQSTMRRVTLMTYNIHAAIPDVPRSKPYIPSKDDVKNIAQVILQVNPDIVALQEVDNQFGNPTSSRSAYQNLAKELARLTSRYYAFGSTIDADPMIRGSNAVYVEWGSAKTSKTNRKPHGEYGNAILSKYPISQVRNFDLPNRPAGENRACLTARIKLGKTLFSVYATHLAHDSNTDRRDQIREIIKIMEKDKSVSIKVLMGDFNNDPMRDKKDGKYQPEFDIIQPLLDAGYIDSGSAFGTPEYTFSARNLFERIDYIFVPKTIKIDKTFTIPSSASDHIPLVTIMEVPE
jgi:endonuclease/exonuclease/phosphatase family metal-dependent hydrolase